MAAGGLLLAVRLIQLLVEIVVGVQAHSILVAVCIYMLADHRSTRCMQHGSTSWQPVQHASRSAVAVCQHRCVTWQSAQRKCLDAEQE